MENSSKIVHVFQPEYWGEVDKFIKLSTTTYEFKNYEQRVLLGVKNHLLKSQRFFQIAKQILPDLDVDAKELRENGYSPARNRRNLAAALEGAITEIYSSVDCAAQVLYFVYGPTSRGFKKSTRRLFRDPQKITGSFPEALKEVISRVDWYDELRNLRDELTHGDVGSCYRDTATGNVEYTHSIFGAGEERHRIDDVFSWVKERGEKVNTFQGQVFRELNRTLKAGSMQQVCGFIDGRVLIRELDTSQPMDFNNGFCISYIWFEKPGMPSCPFQDKCGAYARPANEQKISRYIKQPDRNDKAE